MNRGLTVIGVLLSLMLTARGQQPMLGGELSNSAVTSIADIDRVMPRMRQLGLNTVLVPAYWELTEPREGQFDFTLTDRVIEQARHCRLKVVFLWFGAWKNSMSCYAPLWFKRDVSRFPRAQTAQGKPLEIATPFAEAVFQADNRAFEAWVSHVARQGADVVTMIQVENEIGMLESARDHSPQAEAAYREGVPPALKDYLLSHRPSLHPWLAARIQWDQLSAKSPLWTQVFGNDLHTDEIFMAYHYARYVGRLCQTARRHTRMPLFVNAAMNSRGRQPGQYPSAGPLAHLIDLWHCGAPQLLCLAPDIYDTGFKQWASQYALPGNPLLIPESRCCENSGARALYAFGEHRALGFSPFAIDESDTTATATVSEAYRLVQQVYALPHLDQCPTWGLLFDQTDHERIIADGETLITCRHYFTLPWDARATDGTPWPEGGAMLVKLAADEYLLAGTGVVVSFATSYEHQFAGETVLGEDGFAAAGQGSGSAALLPVKPFRGKRLGIGFVDEVTIDNDGRLCYVRRHNGDQDHQGRHARIAVGQWKLLHIKLYEY